MTIQILIQLIKHYYFRLLLSFNTFLTIISIHYTKEWITLLSVGQQVASNK
jgi:hypothetical protein